MEVSAGCPRLELAESAKAPACSAMRLSASINSEVVSRVVAAVIGSVAWPSEVVNTEEDMRDGCCAMGPMSPSSAVTDSNVIKSCTGFPADARCPIDVSKHSSANKQQRDML